MLLSEAEIMMFLNFLSEKTVVEPSDSFPYRVSVKTMGYSDDKKIGALQAKLSIMLQMVSEARDIPKRQKKSDNRQK